MPIFGQGDEVNKDVIPFAVHEMSETQEAFGDDLQEKLSKTMDSSAWGNNVYCDTIYYPSIPQRRQEKAFERFRHQERDWINPRKFLLYGFSDAAGLRRWTSDPNRPYQQAQEVIMSGLDRAYYYFGGAKPVVIVAHPLGRQVISNYIWNVQSTNPGQGVWKNGSPIGETKGSTKDKFRRLCSRKYLYTTGCNTPIFVAGFDQPKIGAISTAGKGYSIVWKDFNDEDDSLEWPLKPLSVSYRNAVRRETRRSMQTAGCSVSSPAGGIR
jgi:hypothetical protein